MEEARKILTLSAGMLLLVAMLFMMGQIYASMEQTIESFVGADEVMEGGKQSSSVIPEDSANIEKEEYEKSADMEIVISDSSVSKLLVVVLVVVIGGIAVAAILVWREKVRREQEYTREILSKPLEQFASVELDNLKEKYE